MRQFFYKKWVRLCAAVLCMVSVNVMIASFAAIVACEEYGVYEGTKDEWESREFEGICQAYSVLAVTQYQNDFGIDELSDTNFRYGVIRGKSLEEIDLNDKNNYEFCNFDQTVTEDMLYTYFCFMGKEVGYHVADSLFDVAYIHDVEVAGEEEYKIDQYYYVRDMDCFYCLADGRLYPVNPVLSQNDEVSFSDRLHKSKSGTWKNGREVITFDTKQWVYLSGISVVTEEELKSIGEIISDNEQEQNYEDFEFVGGKIVRYSFGEDEIQPYYVISYVQNPLEAKNNFFTQDFFGQLASWNRQDYFVQASFLIDLVFSARYVLFIVFVVSMLLAGFLFVFLMIGAGHQNSKVAVPGFIDRIPLDLFALLVFILLGMFFAVVVEGLAYISIYPALLFGAILMLAAEILSLVFCMSIAVRVKLGGWWKHTICVMVFGRLYHCLKQLWGRWKRFAKRSLGQINRVFPMLLKAWGIMALLACFEFFGIVIFYNTPGIILFLWFVEKMVLYVFLTLCLLQLNALKQAGEKLAAGRSEESVDTSRMFFDMKRHGDNLNHIRDGIQRAVFEQMKSERFKTELITNVSHDIKTPLTSIVNYVDLMKKEEIDNPAVREYLEVLARQSSRLKKLIEDLMEASKASTGNLAVAWEECDAQVMLTQTIGEFEEKMKANQIELIVSGSEAPIVILADPRHLWRIFDNLMNNICKYAQPTTRAYVNVEQKDQSGRIIFRNISKYPLNIESDDLMERFVRGDSSRNTEGSGLGLSIANSLTELMRGTFDLTVDGDLFKVTITFPMQT